jgi:replicative DNA helicase
MKGLFDRTLKKIEDGMSGRVLAIPTSITKFNEVVYGTRQSCYYLYGGETGTGKTRFARENHVYAAYDYYKLINDTNRLDLEIIDLSLEISAEENMACAISRKIYLDTGKVVPMERILSLDGKLNDDLYVLIKSYRQYFEEFEQKMWVIDEDITPTKFHDILMHFAKKNGKFIKEGRYISECEGYVPNNVNLYTIILLDTINLSEVDSGHETVKSSIDRISRIAVWFRNKCGFTPIIVQQFNAEISAVDRSRYGIKTPLLRDFEDSKRTTKDANVVFGLFEPLRHMRPDESLFMGYDVTILKSWFRSLHLIKHRNGPSNKFIPLQFKGAVGVFAQLPDAPLMDETLYRLATRY